MKTDISIPNPIFQAAESLAKKMGISLSELYLTALTTYIMEHQKENITDVLNHVLETAPALSALFSAIVLVASPSVGDLDDDGSPDVLMPMGGGDALVAFSNGGKRRDFEHFLSAWSSKTGAFLPGFPRVIEDWQFVIGPTVAEVSFAGHGLAHHWL